MPGRMARAGSRLALRSRVMKPGCLLQIRSLVAAAARLSGLAILTLVLVFAVLSLFTPPAALQTTPGEPPPTRDRHQTSPYHLYGYTLPHPRV